MISVEKRVPNRNSSSNYRTSIGFTVNPNADQPEGVRVELVSRAPEASTIRMTNDKGQTILHDDQGIGTRILRPAGYPDTRENRHSGDGRQYGAESDSGFPV